MQLCIDFFGCKGISQYINIIKSGCEAVEEEEKLVEKYFKGYKVYLAYCEKNDDGLDVLHISLVEHIRAPTKISDVLQKENI